MPIHQDRKTGTTVGVGSKMAVGGSLLTLLKLSEAGTGCGDGGCSGRGMLRGTGGLPGGVTSLARRSTASSGAVGGESAGGAGMVVAGGLTGLGRVGRVGSGVAAGRLELEGVSMRSALCLASMAGGPLVVGFGGVAAG